MNKDYYAILGIPSTASQEEIRLAYEKMILLTGEQSPSLEKKIEIEEAYFVLFNPQTRSQYDRIYNNASHLVKNFDGFDSSKLRPDGLIGIGEMTGQVRPSFLNENLGGQIGIKNLSEGLNLDMDFEDLEGALPENFTEIFQTAIKNIINVADQIKIVQTQDENLKNGIDIFLDLPLNAQRAEKGGYIPLDYERYIYCSQCQNKDSWLARRCSKCNGAGRVIAHRRVEIKIPKNSADGVVLQVANEGHAGSPGSPNGDLFIKVIIRDEI